ncbi:MAG: DUF547 domain-containing protein [Pseudomonadota bacterium]|nr:DUF547 domain-containing protein [Pseudomonadota bacterium]
MLLSLVALAHALDPSHAKLQKVLDARLSGGRVDYAALEAAPADLDAYLAEVAAAPVASLSAADKKALYINAYNAYTLDLIADNFPLASIRDLDFGLVWDIRKFNVGGAMLTLNDIEGKNLRNLGDPRIHAAVNCASLGCPPIAPKVYTGTGLDAQLDAASRAWASTATLSGTTLTVNKIFDWYGDDFTPTFGSARFDIPGLSGKEEAAANFIAHFSTTPARAEALRKGGYTVTFADYSWKVNAKQ